MTKTVRCLVFRGHEYEARRMVHEGSTLFDKGRNQRYAIKSAPVLIRRSLAAGGSGDVFLCSAETTTTFEPPREGSVAAIGEREYHITPEFLAELLDNRDLAALNQASRPVPVLLLVFAVFAGMGLYMVLQLAFKAFQRGGA